MSYQSLARKYRPKTFSDLVGQEPVARALANALSLKREPSAVLFSGVRGIGKTTIARIFAKALNCDIGMGPTPCGTCYSCKAISEGYHEDVVEIDGASHNSVDEVRALKEALTYKTQRSPYKVYILDEVHMLSISAFNALLKILEEPPPQVIFVFATTELHKIPKTISGRCLTFHLRPMSIDTIRGRIRTILQTEQVPFEESLLPLIAREGRGSMRDALSFLDQVIALGGGSVSREAIQAAFGPASSLMSSDLIRALLEQSPAAAVDFIQKLSDAAVDWGPWVIQFCSALRNASLIRELGFEGAKDFLSGLAEEEGKVLAELVRDTPSLTLSRLFRTFTRCCEEMSGSELDRYIFENYCLECCLDPGLPDLSELLQGGLSAGRAGPLVSTSGIGVSSGGHASSGQQSRSEALTSGQLPQPVQSPTFTQSPSPMAGGQTRQPEPSLHASPREDLARTSPQPVRTAGPSPFPQSWQDLVQDLKKKKPLQARKWEEVHLIQYSAQKIVIAVSRDGIFGPRLLERDEQQRMLQDLREHFEFRGELKIVEKGEGVETESLLETRQREEKEKKERVVDEAVSHPITRGLVAHFSGSIPPESVMFLN
ncbi:MAG: DNA polymerase III subunit gamma/tau [Oligoflexales bacterium]|nr:DNA polymerase III subunit gamma/tau [Oligoflexales bacterium]